MGTQSLGRRKQRCMEEKAYHPNDQFSLLFGVFSLLFTAYVSTGVTQNIAFGTIDQSKIIYLALLVKLDLGKPPSNVDSCVDRVWLLLGE